MRKYLAMFFCSVKKMDDDPKNPVYIATQGPLKTTTNDFWHMVWEQGSVVIVSLCRTVENGTLKCNQFWPANGFEVNDKYEVCEPTHWTKIEPKID